MSSKTRRHHQPIQTNPAETTGVAEPIAGEQEPNQLIRIRAYAMWEQAGHPHGDESREKFWCEAEKELRGVDTRTLPEGEAS